MSTAVQVLFVSGLCILIGILLKPRTLQGWCVRPLITLRVALFVFAILIGAWALKDLLFR